MGKPSKSDLRAQKRIFSHADAQREAEKIMYRGIADYIAGATEDEYTLSLNRKQFEDIGIESRMGEWFPNPKLETEVLGQKLAFPVMTAPCGGMRLVHPDGDIGIALGAKAAGINHILSTVSMYSMEEVKAVAPDAWFQLYKLGNTDMMWAMVERAQNAGYTVIAPTIDSQAPSIRERDYRNGFNLVQKMTMWQGIKRADQLLPRAKWAYRFWRDGMPFQMANTVGLTKDGAPFTLSHMAQSGAESHSPMWHDIEKLREVWKGKLVVKGVMSLHDAQRALDLGADGIVISNHGGRQLEFGYTITETVAEVAAAMGDKIEIMADSGVRRGTDVIKLLSLGAKAVLIGRLSAWGLAVGGQSGVEHILGRLKHEIKVNMQLTGVNDVRDLGLSNLRLPEYVQRRLDVGVAARG